MVPIKKERELFPGLSLRCPSLVALPPLPQGGSIPALVQEYQPASLSIGGPQMGRFVTEFPYILGSSNPCPTAVHMEPFSTTAFKVLI